MASEPLVRENETIAGKYLIGRTLGEGGMGVVVAARHLELDQMVAIKFLRPEIALEGSSAERFRREARAAGKIRSEHVCRVLDVGTLSTGVPYLVMEYLEGCDLSDELFRRNQIPAEEAVGYVLQSCEALAEAHAAGIVHRDLKPGNLFLDNRRDGTRGIKVLDFGVSKSVIESAGQLRLTKTASLVGSPLYMSPEQLDAQKDVDPRADIWALGTILYELIAGRTPFYAETIPQLVHAVMSGTPPRLAEFGVDVAPELEEVISRSLAKQREVRFGSVAEFARALANHGPPHAMVSVLRTERVLASTGNTSRSNVPIQSTPLVVTTPKPPSRHDDTITTKTLDVGAVPPKGASATSQTPAPWGHTSEQGVNGRRKGIVAALMVAWAVGILVAFLAFRKGPAPAAESAPPVPAAPVVAAPPAPSPAAVVDPAPKQTPHAEPPPEPFAAPIVKTETPPAAAHASAKAVTQAKLDATTTARSKAATKTAPPEPPAKATPGTEGISDFGGRR